MNLKGSQTEKNLMTAFAGESQARNKYDFFASVARKEGYEQIAQIFADTALNEKEHAKLWYKEFAGIGSTIDNLLAAAAGEHFEWAEMYKKFSETAKAEGFIELSNRLALVGAIERQHEERYLRLLDNIKKQMVFNRDKSTEWVCRNCGHHHIGEKAPDMCAVCAHPQAYFEITPLNY